MSGSQCARVTVLVRLCAGVASTREWTRAPMLSEVSIAARRTNRASLAADVAEHATGHFFVARLTSGVEAIARVGIVRRATAARMRYRAARNGVRVLREIARTDTARISAAPDLTSAGAAAWIRRILAAERGCRLRTNDAVRRHAVRGIHLADADGVALVVTVQVRCGVRRPA